jgi:hypothetical protein
VFVGTPSDTTGTTGPDGGDGATGVPSIANVMEGEFFLGLFDPGEGNALPIFAEFGELDQVVEQLVRTSYTWNFTGGPQMMNVRIRSSDGQWGPVYRRPLWSEGPQTTADLIDGPDTLSICPGTEITLDFVGPNTHLPTWFDESQGPPSPSFRSRLVTTR